MAKFYVELTRPCYPQNGIDVIVHKQKDFCRDALSPDMTAVFQVDMVRTKKDAIACVMEYAAGFRPCVRLIFGGRKEPAKV